ncbi:MAG: acetate--CoA ligase family protein [Patescibacteria group bacterium]
MNLENFFNPKSVAVIGASSDTKKVGFALISNLLKNNPPTDGRKIFPVTLSEKEILGMETFSSILNIPDQVDLAIIAVRADIVPNILVECSEKHVSNAIIISSGFKEMGIKGKELENEISKIAKEKNITLLGPNCLGVIDTKKNLNASFGGRQPLPGSIAFLSQSGALGTALIDWSIDEGIGFSKIISLGNEAQLTEIDFLEFLENDPETSAILMYLENINDGPKFLETVKRITLKKPVVIIKAGMGNHGNLAVMSHTGALAPQPAVFISACRQAGATTVSSVRGFFNIIKILSQIGFKKDPIQHLIILTNGGGPSVVAADLIDRSRSLSLAVFSENIKEELRATLPKMAAIGNPVDIIGDALADRYDKALEILCKAEDCDAIMVILTPQMMTEAAETAKVLAKYKDKKIIFPVFIGGEGIQAGRNELIKSGLVHFVFPRDVIDSLDYLAQSSPKRKPNSGHHSFGHHGELMTSVRNGEMMEFKSTLELLSQYNISIEGRFLTRKEDLGNALNSLGSGPYTMKAISKEAVHKTETGAVKLNILSVDEANWIWEDMWTKIPKVEGIIVQKMEKGREIIIGMKRDNTFGPTILFGLGGIFAEAIKDTVLRVAPIGKIEALEMMQEIKGIKILQGLRGQPPVNFEMLADILVNLSKLSLDHPEIKEIDFNPVMATENSAIIVDVRIMI